FMEYRYEPYATGRHTVWIGFLTMPVVLLLTAPLAFGLMALCYELSVLLGWVLGDWTNYLLYAGPLSVFLFAKFYRDLFDEAKVDLHVESKNVAEFQLGRLEALFGVAEPGVNGFFFGACFGFQVGLHYFTRNHGGLAIAGGLGECFLLSLDNVCHGIFLDTFELYGINLAGKIEHDYFSASVFYVFRLAYDVVACLTAYQVYLRWQVRNLFKTYPVDL